MTIGVRVSGDCWRPSHRLSHLGRQKGATVDDGNATSEVWARLIREIITSRRLVFHVMLLLLASAPAVAAVVLVILVLRWS